MPSPHRTARGPRAHHPRAAPRDRTHRPPLVPFAPRSSSVMQTEPARSLVGHEYEVEVGPVAHGGHCVARTESGQVLFVRHTQPGERVVARVTEGEEGARFLRADA